MHNLKPESVAQNINNGAYKTCGKLTSTDFMGIIERSDTYTPAELPTPVDNHSSDVCGNFVLGMA